VITISAPPYDVVGTDKKLENWNYTDSVNGILKLNRFLPSQISIPSPPNPGSGVLIITVPILTNCCKCRTFTKQCWMQMSCCSWHRTESTFCKCHARYDLDQSINQCTFVKRHKSRANRRRVKTKDRLSGYRMLWQKFPSLKHVWKRSQSWRIDNYMAASSTLKASWNWMILTTSWETFEVQSVAVCWKIVVFLLVCSRGWDWTSKLGCRWFVSCTWSTISCR